MAGPKLKPAGFLETKITDLAVGREVSALTQAVATIAAGNKTPFFPAYTDHGVDHLQAVLDWCVRLTPEDAQSELGENDAAVIIGAALLHDVAMHLHVPGFVELVGGGWPPPLPWFDQPQGRRPADRPWDQLWDAFKAEARHFDHVEIVRLLGPDHDGTPKIVFDEAIQPQALTEADRLYIGEFLRRHHARLAHEIAVHGFPGVGGDFPAPEEGVPTTLRELMGLVARSHNEDLRLIVDHMKQHRGAMARQGVHVPYVAALLRIADFAQLDFQRAPSLLLRMAEPQSQISIDEWAKHKAVALVDDDEEDPDAIRIEVAGDIRLHTYLQLEELFAGLQQELDTCSAVLAEVYGSNAKLAGLRLARRRLRHNLASPELQTALPFVPRESRLRSAEDMFRLVIHDLYGDHPWVAGRELAQNALDAVRERWRVEASGAVRPADEGWPDPSDPSVDVLAEIGVDEDDQLLLRVADRGIGMTADTVVDYFLRAGASLGPSARELGEIPQGQAAQYVKAGRFGIGVLAAFLLGDEVEVRTRHLTEATGLSFTTRLDSTLVPIARRVEMPVGTEVIVRASASAVHLLGTSRAYRPTQTSRSLVLRAASELGRWMGRSCALDSPSVRVRQTSTAGVVVHPADSLMLDHDGDLGLWQEITVDGFDSVRWTTWSNDASLIHNGVKVIEPEAMRTRADGCPRWSDERTSAVLEFPQVAVVDHQHRLPLTLTRYRARSPFLPFEDGLLSSIGLELAAMSLVPVAIDFSPLRQGWREGIRGPRGWYPSIPGIAAAVDVETVHAVIRWGYGLRAPMPADDPGPPPDEAPGLHLWPRAGSADIGSIDRHTHPRYDARRVVESMAAQLDLLGFAPRVVHVLGGDGAVVGPAQMSLRGTTWEAGRPAVELQLTPDAIERAVLSSDEVSLAVVVVGDGGTIEPGGQLPPMAQAWRETIAGPVPYDPAERDALAQRVYEEHPRIRPHIDRQRRIQAIWPTPG